ncbi:hypothetical protein [Streptomyces sp. NRRL F-5135]|uniref:hypothetical protein n=1 Tax=Streptomyces sp. NRRL F-5135 TaxID=1463858 RepID=UPI00131DB3BA|nr:hypothetical protein [Streptomyces sp. NRRL F-5135]
MTVADDRKPRPNPITTQPATVQACAADRRNAQGQGAATTQLGTARSEGNAQAGTR